jgi:protein phosphatase
MANDAGGTDNISALAVRIEATPSSAAVPKAEPLQTKALELDLEQEEETEEEAPPSDERPTDAVSLPRVLEKPAAQLEGAVRDDVVRRLEAGAEVDLSESTLLSVPDEIRIARCKKCDCELFVGNLFCVECGTPVD